MRLELTHFTDYSGRPHPLLAALATELKNLGYDTHETCSELLANQKHRALAINQPPNQNSGQPPNRLGITITPTTAYIVTGRRGNHQTHRINLYTATTEDIIKIIQDTIKTWN